MITQFQAFYVSESELTRMQE